MSACKYLPECRDDEDARASGGPPSSANPHAGPVRWDRLRVWTSTAAFVFALALVAMIVTGCGRRGPPEAATTADTADDEFILDGLI